MCKLLSRAGNQMQMLMAVCLKPACLVFSLLRGQAGCCYPHATVLQHCHHLALLRRGSENQGRGLAASGSKKSGCITSYFMHAAERHLHWGLLCMAGSLQQLWKCFTFIHRNSSCLYSNWSCCMINIQISVDKICSVNMYCVLKLNANFIHRNLYIYRKRETERDMVKLLLLFCLLCCGCAFV